MFFATVSIAVAAIPEGLPAVMTVTLAIGVERMARRNAIIRRLPAVETLVAVTSACADKTKTLTRNEMTAKTIRTVDEEIDVEGVGYEPRGGFSINGKSVDLEEYPTAFEMARAGTLCNDAQLHREGDAWKPEGDPTEAALIVLARKAGLERERENDDRPRLDVIPLASERRYMATLNRDHEGNHFIYVKGAPERVLEMCRGVQRGDAIADLDSEAWQRWAEEIADHGQRLLAAARKDVEGERRELSEKDVERDLVLLGLFSLINPPREEAIEAIGASQSAGIRVKTITGDHATTARAIGLNNPDEVLTGREIKEIADDE